jgi:hypothetical protein
MGGTSARHRRTRKIGGRKKDINDSTVRRAPVQFGPAISIPISKSLSRNNSLPEITYKDFSRLAQGGFVITEEQKDEMLAKGKRLMTVEEWEEFANCIDCNHRKCSHCIRETIAIADIAQFIHGMEGVHLELFVEDYPPQLHDQVIRCSFCGSCRHITDWLRESFWPELYVIPEIEQAILKVARDNENQN